MSGVGIGIVGRRQEILGALARAGRVEVTELARLLDVAEETVRRDLRALEADGRLRRAHGGAIPLEDGDGHPVTRGDGETQADADAAVVQAVAAAALESVADGDAMYLGGGAIGEALAALLPAERTVRIVTASVPVALAAARGDRPPVIHLLGGLVGDDGRASGPWARELAATVRVDVAVLEADGIDARGQLLTRDADAAAVADAAIAAADRVVLVVGPRGIGRGGLVGFAELAAVDLAVLPSDRASGGSDDADADADADLVRRLVEAGVEVRLVGAFSDRDSDRGSDPDSDARLVEEVAA